MIKLWLAATKLQDGRQNATDCTAQSPLPSKSFAPGPEVNRTCFLGTSSEGPANTASSGLTATHTSDRPMDVRDSAYRNMAASHKLVVLAKACNAEKDGSFLHLQAASIGTVFNTLSPKMLAKKNTGYSQRFEPENRAITFQMCCGHRCSAGAKVCEACPCAP